jgi:hypothetical protein
VVFQLVETLDVDVVRAIASKTTAELLELEQMIYDVKYKEKTGVKYPNPLANFKRLLDRVPDGRVKVKYVRKMFGRMLASTPAGVQPLVYTQKYLRAMLAGDDVVDVDGVAAHPSLFLQLAEAKDMPRVRLSEYVDDPAGVRRSMAIEFGTSIDTVKTVFTAMCFGQSPIAACRAVGVDIDDMPAFIVEYASELKALRECVWTDDEFKDMKRFVVGKAKNKSKGIEAKKRALFATWAQDTERRVITSMIRQAQRMGYVVIAVIHDGFLLSRRKRDGSHADDARIEQIFEALEETARDETGYAFCLAIKPPKRCPAFEEALRREPVRQEWTFADLASGRMATCSYADVKHVWEQRFALVRDHNSYYDLVNKRAVSKKQLEASYEHVKMDYTPVLHTPLPDGSFGDRTTPEFLRHWMGDPCKRSFAAVKFAPPPLTIGEDDYNVWEGYEEVDMSDADETKLREGVAKLKEFIHILLNEVRADSEFLLDWVATVLQKPGCVKMGVLVVLTGEEGVGKSFFAKILQALVGDEFFFETDNPIERVWGRFAVGRLHRIFVVLNEVNKSGVFRNSLWDMTTEPTFQYERKMCDPITMANTNHMVATTNHSFAIPPGRRVWSVEVSWALRNNRAYFRNLSELLQDKQIVKAFRDELLARDVSRRSFAQQDLPVTDHMRANLRVNGGRIKRFLFNVLVRMINGGDETIRVRPRVLADEYIDYVTNRLRYQNVNSEEYAQELYGFVRNLIKSGSGAVDKKFNDGYLHYKICRCELKTYLDKEGFDTDVEPDIVIPDPLEPPPSTM